MHEDNDELEVLVDRELRRLPTPRAPQTLLPCVLAAVEAWAQRPWYTRAWFAWPAGWRVLSLAPLALLGYALWGWSPPPAPRTVVAATDASRVVWSALIEPLLPYILLVVLLMGVVCAAVGLALNYVLLERAEQR
jgi:hypothetical protein